MKLTMILAALPVSNFIPLPWPCPFLAVSSARAACQEAIHGLDSMSPQLANTQMKDPGYMNAAAAAVILALAPGARSASPAPPFEVAYRAWDVVTDLARHNRDPNISGECGKTFRPFVVPGLRGQTKQEQDVAAVACLEAARSACMNIRLRMSADTAKRCDEFR